MPIAIVLFCCAVSFYIFSLLSLNHSLLDSDLYYHLAVARLYSSQEQLTTLPWAKESIWSMGFGDTHLLFHQLLRLANSIGIKQFIALFIGINLFAFLKVNKPKTISEQLGMVLLFLFGSYIFTGRLLFAKGLIVFLPILFLYIYYWKEKNIKIIFGLSFIAVWTYPLAPILLVYSTIDSILQKWFHKEKFPIKELIISYSAFMIGILIHPSFPHQFKMFYWEWFGQIFPPPNIEPIAEWMAPEFNLFVKSFIALILLGIFFYKKSDISFAIVFLLGVVSSYFTTKSIEWSVPFGLMWIASSAEFRTFLNSKYSRITIIPILLLGSSLLGLGVQSQLKKQSNSFKREHASFLCRELPTEIKIWIRWDDFQEFVYECPNRSLSFWSQSSLCLR
jgi:hypothetical protein